MSMKISNITLLILAFSLCFTTNGYCNNKKLLPRFVATKSGEVNARTGPGIKYPIDWIFIKKGEPLEITAEFEQWRYVKDIKGEGGWVHSSVLSGKRSVIIRNKEIVKLQKSADLASRVVAKLLPDLRCQFQKCKAEWCKIKCQSHDGWVLRKYLWGVYPDE
jgi:SH3-like domain-containing protein